MTKNVWKPGTMIYPVPALMVSCGNQPKNFNIITVSWTGTVCSDPAMCYISLRPQRHSYQLIKKTKEFVINLTTKELVKAADWCGVCSGKDYNKFKHCRLTAVAASQVQAPLIEQSPVNIECRVQQIIPLGSHDMFLANVLAVNVDQKYLNAKTGYFDLAAAGLISYAHGKYFSLGKILGKFGYSIKRRDSKKK